MIELGNKAKDKITGFEGVLTARSQYITGCDQYAITAESEKKGQEPVICWFDEGRIEILAESIAPEDVQGEKNGGPQCHPFKG
jgi:hypothetical protein